MRMMNVNNAEVVLNQVIGGGETETEKKRSSAKVIPFKSVVTGAEENVQTFTFPVTGQGVRIIEKDGEPWFVARDVAVALEYSINNNLSTIFKNVPAAWKGSNPITTLGGTQNLLTISEQGLYFFLGRSDKPKALPYQMWVAGDVIPALRKTRTYTIPTPPPSSPNTASDDASIIARAFLMAKEDLARAQAQAQIALSSDIIADITPKADCFTRFLDAKGSITVTEAAKHFGMTAQDLGVFLRSPKVKWLFRNMQGNNMPTKPTLEKGYMRVVTRTNSITGYIAGQGRITPKGMDTLQALLRDRTQN